MGAEPIPSPPLHSTTDRTRKEKNKSQIKTNGTHIRPSLFSSLLSNEFPDLGSVDRKSKRKKAKKKTKENKRKKIEKKSPTRKPSTLA